MSISQLPDMRSGRTLDSESQVLGVDLVERKLRKTYLIYKAQNIYIYICSYLIEIQTV